ncbi:unnamed protein product [marine sediment metagenome]|uniref:Uncharacterized protein n=1 Tax=marine sediment metagenome TaxID=412755 RepID=X1JK00_9ZZZZ
MPTFKNIRIKKRSGGTRLQRVQVLASGKYKFVKNLVKGKSTKSGRKANSKRKTNVTNKRKMFRTLGTTGALEDFAWGFGGLVLMGTNNPAALPTVRLIQGVQGHVFNRVGKGRLIYALIDLADLIIVGAASVQSIFDSARQLTKVAAIR